MITIDHDVNRLMVPGVQGQTTYRGHMYHYPPFVGFKQVFSLTLRIYALIHAIFALRAIISTCCDLLSWTNCARNLAYSEDM